MVTMANEVFRRMRNSSRQLTLKTKLGLMTTFMDKMRNSGYSQGSVNGILESGLQHYYRKLVVDLQGGPKINRRNDTNEMETRRKKMTTKNTWFRKRGGQSAKETKDNGWRTNQRLGGGSGGWRPAHLRAHVAPGLQVVEKEAIEPQRKVISTLLVPYSVGSALQKAVQDAEDTFSKLTGAERVRVVEKGGDTLLNTLGRNDPWSAGRSCGDPRCPQCQSRSLLKELKKDAKKAGMELPQGLLTQTSHQCRREGQNYGAQCAECLLNLGRSSTYWGETSRSGRQRMKEHVQDLDRGNVSSPLVMHAVQEHGGVRPNYIFTTAAVEPRPLYRAVRESVQIGSQPWGPDNLNRCQEWGVPRVPILSVLGGDVGVPVKPGRDNPRPGWTADTMTSIGTRPGFKRVKLLTKEELLLEQEQAQEPGVAQPNPSKRPRTVKHPVLPEKVVANQGPTFVRKTVPTRIQVQTSTQETGPSETASTTVAQETAVVHSEDEGETDVQKPEETKETGGDAVRHERQVFTFGARDVRLAYRGQEMLGARKRDSPRPGTRKLKGKNLTKHHGFHGQVVLPETVVA